MNGDIQEKLSWNQVKASKPEECHYSSILVKVTNAQGSWLPHIVV